MINLFPFDGVPYLMLQNGLCKCDQISITK